MNDSLNTITNLWLQLNCTPKMLWYNFDTCVLYFSDEEEDANSSSFIGTYIKGVLLLELQDDIKHIIREESYLTSDLSRTRIPPAKLASREACPGESRGPGAGI